MKLTKRCCVAVFALFSLLFICAPSPAADRPPNIVFLLADDLGYGDLHCYGHPYSRTPNLDKLAADGTRYLQFYATGVTCCPSRTGFMTSKWPASYATYPANGGFGNCPTITELLKKADYKTGHFGKWHIGPVQKPGTYGIDSTIPDVADVKKGGKLDPRGRDAHIYDQAISFIEQNKDHPFYVNVWGHISHNPVNPAGNLVDRWKDLKVDESKLPAAMAEKIGIVKKAGATVDATMARYLADVESMDNDAGRLLKRLDELGLRDNTIVAFSSDQGSSGFSATWMPPAEGDAKAKEASNPRETKSGKLGKAMQTDPDSVSPSDVRLNLMGDNGDHRGGKHNDLEGGVRIPFIIRWPGHVPAGRVDANSVLSGADWLPSLCAVTGTPINLKNFEGEDVSKTWLGQEDHVRTRPLLWKTSATGSDASIRDGKWKLHDANRRRGGPQLYDIVADPMELHNLAAAHPDIVKSLQAKVDAWTATLPKNYLKTGDKDE